MPPGPGLPRLAPESRLLQESTEGPQPGRGPRVKGRGSPLPAWLTCLPLIVPCPREQDTPLCLQVGRHCPSCLMAHEPGTANRHTRAKLALSPGSALDLGPGPQGRLAPHKRKSKKGARGPSLGSRARRGRSGGQRWAVQAERPSHPHPHQAPSRQAGPDGSGRGHVGASARQRGCRYRKPLFLPLSPRPWRVPRAQST